MSDSHILPQCQENEHWASLQVFPPKQWRSKLSILFKPPPSVSEPVRIVCGLRVEKPSVFQVLNATYCCQAEITMLV